MSDFTFRVNMPKGMDTMDFKQALLKGMTKGMFEAEGTSKENYLTGPRPQKLGVVSGRLRTSVKGRAKIKGKNVIGELGTNVEYAPQHELGLTVTIPAHQRRITQAFGKAITPKTINIGAHKATFPKKPLLEPAIEDEFQTIKKFLKDAVLEDWDNTIH